MTRKSVISVMTVNIIELDVCTAPPGTGDCATLWVVLRRAQDEGRSDGVFRLLPSAGLTAFPFDIRCSKHELCKAPALCVFVAIVPRTWWRGGATRRSGCEESRLGQGKCPCRDDIGKENAHKGRGNPAFKAYWATKKVVEREVGVCGEGDEVAGCCCLCGEGDLDAGAYIA